MNEEETIKIGLRFPNDTGVRQFYDYRFRVKDLAGGVVMDETISTLSWRTEVTVPNSTSSFIQKQYTKLALECSKMRQKLPILQFVSLEKCWCVTKRTLIS